MSVSLISIPEDRFWDPFTFLSVLIFSLTLSVVSRERQVSESGIAASNALLTTYKFWKATFKALQIVLSFSPELETVHVRGACH